MRVCLVFTANFTLPDKNLFDEVTYVELQEEEAEALIQKYAKEAEEQGHYRKSGPGGGGPPAKRFRGGDFHHQRSDFRRDRFSSGPQGSSFRSELYLCEYDYCGSIERVT